MFFLIGALLLVVVLGTALLWRMEASLVWKLIGCLPAAGLALGIGALLISFQMTPTGHNLWPFEVIIWSTAGVVCLAVFFAVRWLVQRLGGAGPDGRSRRG